MKDEEMVLSKFTGPIPDGVEGLFHQMVADYTKSDPIPTLERLSRSQGILIGAFAKFILVRYCNSGSETLLEIGPTVVRDMVTIVEEASGVGSESAKIGAFDKLRGMIRWLTQPINCEIKG
mgnify:FL=1